MRLLNLEIRQFRNLEEQKFHPAPGLNLLYGENGSGKTSLLEAIYFLGTVKSFRTNKSNSIISKGAEEFTLFGNVSNSTNSSNHIGIQKSKSSIKVRINRENINSAASIARNLPLQIIDLEHLKILTDGPEARRRFIEWGAFHVEPTYGQKRKRFYRSLQQRNASLRVHGQDNGWDKGLISSAIEISELQEKYLNQLLSIVKDASQSLQILHNCSFEYLKGWPEDADFQEALENSLSMDRERGFTQYGPHRSDIRIKYNKDLAKDVLSRGQIKFVSIILLILQCVLLEKRSNKNPLILLDDVVSELDIERQRIIFTLLNNTQSQVFITSPHKEALLDACHGIPYGLFHVEHGLINQVV